MPTTRRNLTHRVFKALLAVVVVTAVVYLVGPRNAPGQLTPSQRNPPPQSIAALDEWLVASEAAYSDIKPGNAKGIVWNATPHQRTAWSVVYLHGFSASRLETAPLADQVGKALKANVFYTRYSGHGRSGAAMGEANVQDWMADTLEAVAVGQTIGEHVLVISCSTGSTLATLFATTPEGRRVAAHVFVSPNFGPKDKKAELINGPWGRQIALTLEGETRGWIPDNAREANAWSSRYPTRALFPMMAAVKAARESDLSLFQTPVLALYSELDQTVDPVETRAAIARFGTAHKTLEPVTYSKAKGQHVLVGDIKDAAATLPMAQSIVQWVQTLPMTQN
jgi:alpha-beta hydrolase superfamily lysophospholipase